MRARESSSSRAGNDAFRLRSQSVECDGLDLSIRLGSDEAFGRAGVHQVNVRAFHIGKSRISAIRASSFLLRGLREKDDILMPELVGEIEKRFVAREPVRPILAHWLAF
jgi:hypothetical protein